MDTTILVKRSANLATAANSQLQYGEPLYTDDDYFTVGNGNESLVSQRNVIRFIPKAQADSQLYYTVNPSGKIVINILNGSTLTPVLTFGEAAQKDVATSAVEDSGDLITSGAVKQIETNLENSIQSVQTSVQELEQSVSEFADKTIESSVTQGSDNPVTAGAVYDFVMQVVNEAFGSYVPWATNNTDRKKFYINNSTGIQYYNGSKWTTVPVGYT